MTDTVTLKREFHEPTWEPSYGLFSRVIDNLNLEVGAEIGVAFGGHSEAILRQTKIRRLYGVDRYKQQRNYDDPMNLRQRDFDELFARTSERLARFGDRFKLLRCESRRASEMIREDLDFVYIDADHSYTGVINDLCCWFDKIRVGGIIGGHDYDHPNFPGVKRAIHEFFDRFGWEVRSEGEGVWWVLKQRLPLSVFIPAYNSASTIEDAVRSVLSTNLEECDELIIVDDGSTDNTPAKLKKLSDFDSRVRIITHSTNLGGGAARNTCVKNSKNQILFCLDSDNVLVEGSLPRLKQFLIGSGTDVATFQEVHYFESAPGHITNRWKYKPATTTLADYLSGHVHAGSSGNYMFTRVSWEKAGGYPESTGPLDTWGFGLRQLATGSRMTAMPASYYHHRQGHDSYWTRESKKMDIDSVALQLVASFRPLLKEGEWERISRDGSRWFYELSNCPLRVKTLGVGASGSVLVRSRTRLIRLMRQTANQCLLVLGDERRTRVKGALKSVLRKQGSDDSLA